MKCDDMRQRLWPQQIRPSEGMLTGRRKIIMLVSALNSGGAQQVASILVNAWAERGDSVMLVPTFSGRGENLYAISEKVAVVYLADFVKGRKRTIFNQLARLIALRKLIRNNRPDVVISFLSNVNIAAILATRGTTTPVMVCEQTDPAHETKLGVALRWLRRVTYPLADMVTIQTENAAASFRVMVPGMKNLEVVPNPLSQEIEKTMRANGAPRERKRLIAMGRLSPEKQFRILVDVYARLATRFTDWDLWIWGEGSLRGPLELRVAELGLSGRVFLPGRTSQPWTEMAKGHVFVLSSAFEGLPNVLLEAMALGMPCVAFDCPSGPREITRGGEDGLLVPRGDTAALQAALARVMDDEALRIRLGTKAAVSVRERYSLARVIDRWDELFLKVCHD